MSVQQQNNKANSAVDGVISPLLNGQPHGGKSTGQDAFSNCQKDLMGFCHSLHQTSTEKCRDQECVCTCHVL